VQRSGKGGDAVTGASDCVTLEEEATMKSIDGIKKPEEKKAMAIVSQMPLTGMRSEYFWRMRSASALRFSKGCSSLNLLRILSGVATFGAGCDSDGVTCCSFSKLSGMLMCKGKMGKVEGSG